MLFCIFLLGNVHAQYFDLQLDSQQFLYRYIENPIKVTVNPQDSLGPISVTANTAEVRFVNPGELIFKPISDYKTATLTVSSKDKYGKSKVERFEFELRDIEIIAHINNETFLNVNKSDLSSLEIQANIRDFTLPLSFEVLSFKVKVPNKEEFLIEGNNLPDSVINQIKKIKREEFIVLYDINFLVDARIFSSRNPIIIKIK